MTDRESGSWHSNTISAATDAMLRALRDARVLDRFYLAGGTALALQFGHRLSRDLDFFTPEHFDEDALLQQVQQLGEFSLTAKAPHTLHTVIQGTKVSFLGYAYPVLYPAKRFQAVAVADPRDIACMKVSAIASRGAKRDFIDLYVCARHYGLKEILHDFDSKYAQANFNKIHLLKSLTYFADADKDPMPHMLEALDWDRVKQFFLTETSRLL